ncbi:MAG: hypothetical protein ABI083_19415 [Lapillicoccus sp.]
MTLSHTPASTGLSPQDAVGPPRDAVFADAPAAPVAPARTAPARWSGRRTAIVAALVLGLTTIGGVTAAVATPDGIAGPAGSQTGFGPGGHPGGFGGAFGGGRFRPGQQSQPGQQGTGFGPGAHFGPGGAISSAR